MKLLPIFLLSIIPWLGSGLLLAIVFDPDRSYRAIIKVGAALFYQINCVINATLCILTYLQFGGK
jgi:hypothetical protein